MRSLTPREADPEHPYEIEIACHAVAKTLRALGRAEEARQHAREAERARRLLELG